MKFSYQELPIHQSANPSAPRISRPYLPVYLHRGRFSTPAPYYALLDSGADNVLMPIELAEMLGIRNIETSRRFGRTIGIGGQTVDIYFHNLKIQVLGDTRKLSTVVGFGKVEIPILGRDFFKHFRRVIFDEEKKIIELKK